LSDTVAIAGKSFTYQVPSNTFTNADADPLTYTAGRTDGLPFPTWLTFDASSATFTGFPANSDHETLEVEVAAYNSAGSTASDIFQITVQAIPEVDLNGSDLGRSYSDFMTEDGPDSITITAPGVFISDNDGNVLTKVISSLSEIELYDPAEEYLLVTDEAIAAAQAAGLPNPKYNPVSGDIIIVGAASLAQYATILKEIRYVNISEDPDEGSRNIVFLATDEDGNESNTIISDIFVSSNNDPPTLDIDADDNNNDGAAEFSNTFVEDGPAVVITDSDVEITDVDHDGFAQIVVSVTNRIDGDLEILSLSGSLPAGFSRSYNDSGDLIISGNGSLVDYESALKLITYRNNSQNPDDTPRSVRITYDDLGTNGAVSNTTTIYVIPKNDPPDGHADTLVVAEYSQDNPFTLPPPSDVDNALEELEIIVNALPDLGVVTQADGRPVAVGDRLPATAFTTLQYDTPDNYDGLAPPGRLVYTVEDDSAATATSTVTFLINNAPEADDFTVTTAEDVEYVFVLADFADGYFDAEGDTLAFIVVNSLPLDGWLLLEGDTVRIDDELRLTALDSGKLVYTPSLNGNGDPYTSFLFRVKDERQAISEPYVASIVVTPVSDPPSVDTVRVSGPENETVFFSASDFKAQFSDPEGDTLTKVKIERLPPNGMLLFKDQPVVVGDELPVGQLDSLAFVPNAGFDGTTQFLWNGHDGSAYAERPAPAIIIILEDNTLSAIDSEIRMEDILVYTGSLLPNVINPANGALVFTTSPVVATEHGTLTIEPDGTFTYETTDDFSGTDAFTFEVCNTATPAQCAQAIITIIVINGRLDSDRDGIPDAEEEPLVIYEGFSPDGDGMNDVWRIRSIENYPNNTVRIFNRWGNLVFEIKGYNNQDQAWSSHSTAGLVAGDVPDGTYFYLIDLGNNQPPRSGYVIVNR
jgi:gliding motility-associated-like protein